jgi:hypothetical protein
MTIASRFYASLAAFALVLAGIMAVTPNAAQAQGRGVMNGALIGGVLVTAAVVTVTLLVSKNDNNDDEGPQSP